MVTRIPTPIWGEVVMGRLVEGYEIILSDHKQQTMASNMLYVIADIFRKWKSGFRTRKLTDDDLRVYCCSIMLNEHKAPCQRAIWTHWGQARKAEWVPERFQSPRTADDDNSSTSSWQDILDLHGVKRGGSPGDTSSTGSWEKVGTSPTKSSCTSSPRSTTSISDMDTTWTYTLNSITIQTGYQPWCDTLPKKRPYPKIRNAKVPKAKAQPLAAVQEEL